jgi:hypothetical protein
MSYRVNCDFYLMEKRNTGRKTSNSEELQKQKNSNDIRTQIFLIFFENVYGLDSRLHRTVELQRHKNSSKKKIIKISDNRTPFPDSRNPNLR